MQVRGTVNRVELIGWLGDMPEQRIFSSGARVCSFSIATKRLAGRDPQGERAVDTDWTTIEAWEKLADQCGATLHKGSRVRVCGSLHTRSWEDKDSGQRRYRTIVRADEVLFLDARSEASAGDVAEGAESVEETDDVAF
jgi:single-strand DNA-binding protein